MQDYRKLDVWRKSHELALEVHRAAPRGAVHADQALTARLQQTAVTIPVIIVLGCGAVTAPAFAESMSDAASVVDELAYLLLFARDAGVLTEVPYAKLEARANQLRAMLGGLNRTVRLKMGAEDRVAATRSAVTRAMRAVRDDGSSRRESRPRSTL